VSAKPSVRAGTRSFVVSQAMRVIASFAIATFVARQLGADGKGGLALLQQTPSILALVMGFGFAGVNVYFVGSGKKTAAQALGDSLAVSAVALVVGVPASWAFMNAVPTIRDLGSSLALLASLVVPVSVLTSQVAGILVGMGRPQLQARAQTWSVLANVVAVGVLYVGVHLSVRAALIASVSSSVLALVLMLVALKERPQFAGMRGRMADSASYARKRYFTDVASMLEMRIDIVMLGALSTTAAAGVYSVAVSVVEMLWFIPRAAETPLLSRMLKEHPAKGAELVAISVRLTVLLELVLLAGAALLLKPAVTFVFGPAFTGTPVLFWILAPGVVLNGLTGPVASYLTSQGHQYPGLSAATVASNIALNAALIPTVGVAGAALASSITYGVGSLWLMWRFVTLTGCSPKDLLVPRASDLRALIG